MNIDKDSLQGIQGLLILKINNKEYCCDIRDVSLVLKLDYEILHNYNPQKGIFFYKNETFKIIDIKGILKIGTGHISPNSRVVLIETFGSHFGFLADEILEIIVIDSLLVEYSLDFIPYHRDGFIRGKLVMNDRKILFFDFEKVSKDLDVLEILSISELPEKVLQGH